MADTSALTFCRDLKVALNTITLTLKVNLKVN
jgi:hypothetical protein